MLPIHGIRICANVKGPYWTHLFSIAYHLLDLVESVLQAVDDHAHSLLLPEQEGSLRVRFGLAYTAKGVYVPLHGSSFSYHIDHASTATGAA